MLALSFTCSVNASEEDSTVCVSDAHSSSIVFSRWTSSHTVHTQQLSCKDPQLMMMNEREFCVHALHVLTEVDSVNA